MTKETTFRRLSSFTDLGEAYREATATPEFQAAFGDVNAVSFIDSRETTGEIERAELEMPEPMQAQHDCAAIIATVFDLFRSTRLEASAQAIAWGIVNSFHYEAGKIEREEDGVAHELAKKLADPEPGEIYNLEVEELQGRAQTLAEQRAALECMRDYAACVYRVETGRAWTPARGSRVSSATTASQIAAADFLKARATAHREQRNPTGPLVVFSGGQEWHDWEALYERLDLIKQQVPHMTLCTTAQRKGADAIAAAWAGSRGVPLVAFVPETGRYGRRAGFVRNEKLASLRPVQAIVCQGSGLQSNLLDVLKKANVPTHAFRIDAQRPATDGKPTSAREMLAQAGARFGR